MIEAFNLKGEKVDLGEEQGDEDYQEMGEQLLPFLMLLSQAAKTIVTKVVIDHEKFRLTVEQK